MAFNISRSAQFADKEILKYGQPNLLAKSVVLDANAFTQATGKDARTIVPAGTILMLSATYNKRYVEYTGGAARAIKGILKRAVELMAGSTAASEPAAAYFHNAVFATTQIVGFTLFASALVNDLGPSCKFE